MSVFTRAIVRERAFGYAVRGKRSIAVALGRYGVSRNGTKYPYPRALPASTFPVSIDLS